MKIAFQPDHEIRGTVVSFTRKPFANREYAKEWFVHAYSTGGEYGGHYIRRVGWPKDQAKRSGGFSRVVGWKRKKDAVKAAAIISRYIKKKKL